MYIQKRNRLTETENKVVVTKSACVLTQLCLTLCDPQPTRLLCPWHFPDKNTGVGCHFLLQGSAQPRDRTRISSVSFPALAGEFFAYINLKVLCVV